MQEFTPEFKRIVITRLAVIYLLTWIFVIMILVELISGFQLEFKQPPGRERIIRIESGFYNA